MHYSFDLTIPAQTIEVNPVKLICPLTNGIINKVSVEFPPGCHRLVHIRIFRYEHQIFPLNINSSFIGDTFPIEFNEYYPLVELPYEVRVEGWNDDDTYQHHVVVRFDLLSEKVLGKAGFGSITEGEIKALLGEYEMIGV